MNKKQEVEEKIEEIKWFSTDDKMPKHDTPVLMCYVDGDENSFRTGHYSNDGKCLENWGGDSGGSWREPDYWAMVTGPKLEGKISR